MYPKDVKTAEQMAQFLWGHKRLQGRFMDGQNLKICQRIRFFKIKKKIEISTNVFLLIVENLRRENVADRVRFQR